MPLPATEISFVCPLKPLCVFRGKTPTLFRHKTPCGAGTVCILAFLIVAMAGSPQKVAAGSELLSQVPPRSDSLILSPLPRTTPISISPEELAIELPQPAVAYEAVPLAFLLDFLGLVRVILILAATIILLYCVYFCFCFYRRLRHAKAEAEATKVSEQNPSPPEETPQKILPLTDNLDAAQISAVVHEQHRHLQQRTVIKEILNGSLSPPDKAAPADNAQTKKPPTDGLT